MSFSIACYYTCMDTTAARILADLNTAFYGRVADSFSQTRSCPWDGWQRIAQAVSDISASRMGDPLHVADIACGNMRFAAFLQDSLSDVDFTYIGLDNCPSLAEAPLARLRESGLNARFGRCDIAGRLFSEEPLCLPGLSESDLVVCFGFMHHIPGSELRERFLCELLGLMKPGSVLALSFWRFLEDLKLGPKAVLSTEAALSSRPALQGISLEPGDCFLGWQEDPDAVRYCHSFSEAELDGLVRTASSQAQLVDRFAADGKSGSMNTYLVFRKCHTEILH